MKFKLDENLPAEAVRLLRDEGFDAMSVLDQQLGGEPDEVIADVCRAEDRVLLTFDIDFANIRSYPPDSHAGLVVFRLATQEKAHLLNVLSHFVQVASNQTLSGQLWIVEEDRIRIRE